MEENLREINKIMEQFYAKQDENEKLFNANKEETAVLKAKILELKQERTDERNRLKTQLSTLESRKKLIIGQNIQENIPVINNFRDGYKRVLYQQREEELMDKIGEMNKKEDEIKRLKLEIERLKLNIDSLMSSYMLGIDEYDSIMECSFNEQITEFENNLKSRIDLLTKEVEQKAQLEEELKKLRINKDNELSKLSILNTPTNTFSYDSNLNFKAKGIKNKKFQTAMKVESEKELSTEYINSSFILRSLEKSYKAIENKFTLKIKNLLKKSDEEKALEKQVKEIAKRPDYSKVYIKEMLELKLDLGKKFTEQRKIVEPIIVDQISEVSQNIALMQQEVKERDRKLIEKEEEIFLYRENKLKNFKPKFDEFGSITNQDEYEKLKEEYNALLSEKSDLSSQNVDYKIELISELSKQKANLESTLANIKTAASLIKPTTEEANILTTQLELYEQEEYDRRSKAKIAAEEAKKMEERLYLEQCLKKFEEERQKYAVQHVVEETVEDVQTKEITEETVEDVQTKEITEETMEEFAAEEVVEETIENIVPEEATENIIEETVSEEIIEETLEEEDIMEESVVEKTVEEIIPEISEEETTYEKLLNNVSETLDSDLDFDDLVNIDMQAIISKFGLKEEEQFVSINYDDNGDKEKSNNVKVDMIVPMKKETRKPSFLEKFGSVLNEMMGVTELESEYESIDFANDTQVKRM